MIRARDISSFLSTFCIGFSLFASSSSFGLELVGLRPLQSGPIGEGPAFSGVLRGELESGLSLSSTQGHAKSSGGDRESAMGRATEVSAGVGQKMSDSFLFTAYATGKQWS